MSDEDECPTLISAKVPVTILTGFLGSGKTTLLHYVLTAEHQLRIAVIVNEFEFGKTIEKGLTLKSSQKPDDEWLELNNGCMCCTAQTQTVTALEDLMRRKGTFDLILVETAGLADPGPVAAMFWQDEALCGNLFLSGIVTVVDAANIKRYLQDPEVQREATRQILIADKILLNKCDIVSEEQRMESGAIVRGLNPAAEMFETEFSKAPDLRKILFMNTTRSLPPALGEHLHGGAHPSSTITAVPLEFSEPGTVLAVNSPKDIESICKLLLYPEIAGERAEDFEVIRCKAAIWVHQGGTHCLYQLQCIGELFDITPMEGESVPRGCSRALILGKRLQPEVLRGIFEQFLRPTSAERSQSYLNNNNNNNNKNRLNVYCASPSHSVYILRISALPALSLDRTVCIRYITVIDACSDKRKKRVF
eukprot:gene8224-5746_t